MKHRESTLPKGTEWLGKTAEPEREKKIQCYDPPDGIALCLKCPLPRCSGNLTKKCALFQSGKANGGFWV